MSIIAFQSVKPLVLEKNLGKVCIFHNILQENEMDTYQYIRLNSTCVSIHLLKDYVLH